MLAARKLKRKTPLPVVVPSKLQVFDIPIELLLDDDDNPNEMDDATLDMLTEHIRENGFDEPIKVVPAKDRPGYFRIAAGHHRKKVAVRLGMSSVPSVIKDKWDELQAKVELVRNNIVKGNTNSVKFSRLYDELRQKIDAKLLQNMMGFTTNKRFEALYEGVAKNLNPEQRKAFAKAKEKIKSVDDLGSVLNKIFKDAGSAVKEGYVVFSFGGKDHHYITVDDTTNKRLKAIKKGMDEKGESMRDWLQSIIAAAPVPEGPRRLRRVVK